MGIGDPTPSHKLDVNGNINATGDIYLTNNLMIEDDGAGRTQFYHSDGVEHMEFNGYNTHISNKNVYVEENLGLGRDPALESIDARLHVEGNVKIEDGTQGAGKVLTGIKWNFTKFLVDAQGRVVSRHAPTDKPESLAGEIEALLPR